MYALRLAFRNTPDHRLVVEATTDHELAAETIYEDEDSFLRRLIAADLDFDDTRDLVVAVIHAIAAPERAPGWVDVRLSPEQKHVLGLNLIPATSVLPHHVHPFAFLGAAHQFQDFLMQSPTPFAMLAGPEHIVTFINPPYIRILGRTSAERMLGLPIREAIPELEGQLCLSLLDNVYRTGKTQKRLELKSAFREEDTCLTVDSWFDITYQPVRNSAGTVIGVMAQAADVTERVLARAATEHRESQILRLWAEIESLKSLNPDPVENVVKSLGVAPTAKHPINIGKNRQKKFA